MYARKCLANAKALHKEMKSLGFKTLYDGTQNQKVSIKIEGRPASDVQELLKKHNISVFACDKCNVLVFDTGYMTTMRKNVNDMALYAKSINEIIKNEL